MPKYFLKTISYFVFAGVVLGLLASPRASLAVSSILGSPTYRPEIVAQHGVVATGRHFAAEAGMRMLRDGGNAIDAGVASVFAAAITEISHFGMGGEAPMVIYVAELDQVVVINGQGVAPAAASPEVFRRIGGIPGNGPSAGAVPAVVDALAIALAEYGTLSLTEVLQPAITLADGFPWYEFLSFILESQLDAIKRHPSGAKAYLQGPEQSIPRVGSIFRQPELAATLRLLIDEEQRQLRQGVDRKAAIYAARDRFYKGDIGQRIADSVQAAGGLLTAEDMANYRGRVETPATLSFDTRHGSYQIFKTGFWGQGPVLLQTLALLQDYDLEAMGHNSSAYIHTIIEALKLSLADRDHHYGDPDFSPIPAQGLLSADYAAERRQLIDPLRARGLRLPGNPWRYQIPWRIGMNPVQSVDLYEQPSVAGPADITDYKTSPDTTCVNIADAQGNLFSSAPSSAWFYGGVFIAGDTGVPLGNRMQAFVPWPDGHPNLVQGGKRPRTTLSPTVILRDGKPFLAVSNPGGDTQDQQALQVFLNIAVFGMGAQQAIESPRFNTGHHEQSFGRHRFRPRLLELEDRISPNIVETLRLYGHRVIVQEAFKMTTATTVAGFDARYGTLFGAADVRGQRFVVGW